MDNPFGQKREAVIAYLDSLDDNDPKMEKLVRLLENKQITDAALGFYILFRYTAAQKGFTFRWVTTIAKLATAISKNQKSVRHFLPRLAKTGMIRLHTKPDSTIIIEF